MRPETKKAFNNILDTFSGADGGVRFAYFSSFIKSFDEQAANGNDSAKQLIMVMDRFSRLIDASAAERKKYEKE